MKGKPLTDRRIAEAKPADRDFWIADAAGRRGEGALVVRIARTGSRLFYFRYQAPCGTRVNLPVGPYGGSGGSGLTLAEARDKVRELQALHRGAARGDVRAYLEAEQRAAEEQERVRLAAEERARQERDDAARYTLRRLLEIYADRLAAAGKQSAVDARGLFERHVFAAHPHIAAQPASSVKPRDIVSMLRTLTERGTGRVAGKLRSYLHAAYAQAVRAEFDPAAPSDLLHFGIVTNPVAATASLSGFTRARDRVLSEAELRGFWLGLDRTSPLVGDTLRLALLLGGQRLSQLLRARLADVDLAARTLTLYDPKGRRKQPRAHVLPLTDGAREILERLTGTAAALRSEVVFSGDGRRPMRLETLSHAVRGISSDLLGRGAVTAPFRLQDLRRTAETALAGLGISSDVRAQILSHGLSGVQIRHYDKHGYAPEKTAALQRWERRLREIVKGETRSADIVPFPAAAH